MPVINKHLKEKQKHGPLKDIMCLFFASAILLMRHYLPDIVTQVWINNHTALLIIALFI